MTANARPLVGNSMDKKDRCISERGPLRSACSAPWTELYSRLLLRAMRLNRVLIKYDECLIKFG